MASNTGQRTVNAQGETRWQDCWRWDLPAGVMEKVDGRGAEGMGGLGRFVLRFRVPVGIILVLASAFMIYGVTKVQIATNFADFFPRNHPYTQLYEKYKVFGGAQTLEIMLKARHGTIFTIPTLQKVTNITFDVNKMDGVNHDEVYSLASYLESYAESVPGGVSLQPYMYPNPPANQAELDLLRKKVFIHRDALSHLVSRDQTATVINASFNEQHMDYKELFNDAQAIAKKYTDKDTVVYLAGEPMVRGYGYHYLPAIMICFIAAVLAMIVLLYVSLGHRNIWWVPIVTGSLSAIWGLGFVGWMGYNFDPVMLVIPFILTARDLSHGIQWQGRYYNELDASGDKYVAIVATTNYMLPPGFLSIVADIAGIIFVSLGGIPVLHHIGLAGAVWLASTLTMVFVFEPIFLSFSPVPRLKGGAMGEKLWDLTPAFFKNGLGKLVEIPVKPGAMRGGLLIIAGIIMAWGIAAGDQAKIGYDTPGTPLYRANSKINRDIYAISKYFPVDEGWIVIEAKGALANLSTGLAPETLRMEARMRGYLLSDPRIIQVETPATGIFMPFNQMFHNGHPKYYGLPTNVRGASDLMYLFNRSTGPGQMQHYFTNGEGAISCVRLMLRDHTFTTLADVVKGISDYVSQRITPDPHFSTLSVQWLGGIAGLYAAANDVIFELDIINITFVLVVVFVFSVLAFRSFVAGLLFVLSCILANFAAFIYMRLRGIGLTIDTLPVISLGIGLGVDYGIYVVARIQDEVMRGMRLTEAVSTGITATGAAVFSTFAVMVGGIVPWAFSPLLFHNEMSVLLIFLMFTNMFAGVLVLPAFIAWSRTRFISKYETQRVTPTTGQLATN